MQSVHDQSYKTNAKKRNALLLLAILGMVALGSQASGAELGSYLALKGGIYSPSASFNLDNVDVETAFEGDTKSGFAGELALGHYFLPTLALELGVGYFKGSGSFDPVTVSSASRQVDFDVVPVLVSAKAFIPTGPVAPYGEFGIGAYFTDLNVADNLNTFGGSATFGLHAGAGVNVPIVRNVFIGAEGRYVWAEPSFGGKKIRLNDAEYKLNGFTLNGFTTQLALGFSF